MATYTAEQLSGDGVLLADNIPAALPATKFLIANTTSTGSAYFTFETVRNANGFYDSSSPTNARGGLDVANLPAGATLLVTGSLQGEDVSDYIWSVVVPSGGISGFTFDPSLEVVAGTVYLRGTGGISLEIS